MKSVFFILLFSAFLLFGNEFKSPNGKISLQISTNGKGEFFYSLIFEKKIVIKPSRLGLELVNQPNLISGFEIDEISSKIYYEKWAPVWGEIDSIENHYNEVIVKLKQITEDRYLILKFRIFNDGLGFRYEFPIQKNLDYFIIKEENTEFHLTGDHKAFWIPGDYDSQEYTYNITRLSEVDATIGINVNEIAVREIPSKKIVQTPLMLKSKDGLYINIHEAALLDYPAMYLQIFDEDYLLKTHLCPDALGNKAYLQTPFSTPWRTIIVSNRAEDILESKLILNLNEPSRIQNVEWIKPKKYIGIWWGMHVGIYSWNYSDTSNIRLDQVDWKKLKPNGRHGAKTENAKRYIDFAAKHGFDALLIEGWNIGWEDWFGRWKENVFDFVTPYPDFDVEEVSNYAKEKGIELIMHHETSASVTNYERRLDEAFRFLKKYNYGSIKTGYVGRIIPRGEHHDGQWMVNHYTRVLEKAAKEEVCIISHESVRPTGLHRTFPNWLAAEAARGNEFNAWSKGNPPEHETILPFTRFMGGPMDYTPGIFQIKMNYYNPLSTFQVHTTLAKQLALYVVLYSPIQMAADLPENYERFLDAFQFIKDVPVDWKDTKIISAEPGDYIITARKDKNSENWFLGGITDENERAFSIKLDFLDNGKYKATIYRDEEDSHWDKNPMSYKIINKIVSKNDILKLRMAPGGGFAVSFVKIN